MRKQNKIFLWPTYFDSTKTRTQGRKIPKNIAVPTPRQDELREAAQRIGLKTETFIAAKYPKSPWQKTGLIIVDKNRAKTKTIQKISKVIAVMRKQNLE